MLKQIITACASLALTGSIALAGSVDGVFSGSNNGENVSVSLHSEAGVISGQVNYRGATFPLAGREMNGTIQGIWRSPSGQDVPFVAAANQSGLQLQTNGVTYALAKSDATAPGSINPQNAEQMAPVAQANGAFGNNVPAAAPAIEQQLEVHQGTSLQYAVPAGWRCFDNNNGVDASSPDGITAMSHTFVRGAGRCTPEMIMQFQSRGWAKMGINNVQTLSVKDIAPQSKLYELSYLVGNRPAHAMVQATVHPGPGSYVAEMVFIQSSPEAFQQQLPTLIAMAKSVQVIDGNKFADTGEFRRQAMKRVEIVTQTNKEIGDIIINGERERSRIRDESFKGADDTLRDVTRFKDAGGNEYTAPLQAVRAFKHADGTVSYSTSVTTPVPSGATELNPYDYSGR